jgi:hypothetical protein
MIDQTNLRYPTDAKKKFEDEAKRHNLKLAFETTPTSAAFAASATTPAVAVAASDCAAALAIAAPAMDAMDVDALAKPKPSRKAFDFFKEEKGKAIIDAFKECAKAKDAKAKPKAAEWNPAVQGEYDAITGEEKARYEQMEAQDRERYQREMDNYKAECAKAGIEPGAKKQKVGDVSAPTTPPPGPAGDASGSLLGGAFQFHGWSLGFGGPK